MKRRRLNTLNNYRLIFTSSRLKTRNRKWADRFNEIISKQGKKILSDFDAHIWVTFRTHDDVREVFNQTFLSCHDAILKNNGRKNNRGNYLRLNVEKEYLDYFYSSLKTNYINFQQKSTRYEFKHLMLSYDNTEVQNLTDNSDLYVDTNINEYFNYDGIQLYRNDDTMDVADKLYKIINMLSVKYSKIMQMRLIKKMKYDDIAEQLELNLSTVKSRIRAGKHLIVKKYNQLYGQYEF
jgi:DNA-directed RNA polymerase specialized sigma24 family protein